MKKRYLWGAFAVVALASCSQDEVVSIPQNEIKYSVVADKASRAADIYCNNNKPTTFYVSAYFTAATGTGNTSGVYFTEDVLTKGTRDSYSQTNSRYWPDESAGSLDFYAYTDGGEKHDSFSMNANASGASITDYEVDTDVAKQKDLLYAVMKTQSKSESPVELNFRHALSQIVFQAQNKNPNIYVEIYGVEIHNVLNKGTFSFPKANTDGKIVDHNQNGVGDASTGNTLNTISNQGTWQLGTSTNDYSVGELNVAVESNTKVSLTNDVVFESTGDTGATKVEGTDKDKALLLLPQGEIGVDNAVVPFKALTGFVWSEENLRKSTEGAFFFVKCKIWNVAAADVNKDTDVVVYNDYILIPVHVFWKQGHKYVYTFIFDEQGNGGIDPDDGKPVLVPIEYTVTVDDFTNEAETEVDMKDDTVVDTTQKETTTGGN